MTDSNIERVAREIADDTPLSIKNSAQLAACIADGIRAYLESGKIITAEDYVYTPQLEGDRLSYLITAPSGHQKTVSFVPSQATGEGRGTGNVFVYHSDEAGQDQIGEALMHVAFVDPQNEVPS